MSTLPDLIARLPQACDGKSWAAGGLNVIHLKQILTSRGLSTAGKKQDLIQRVCAEIGTDKPANPRPVPAPKPEPVPGPALPLAACKDQTCPTCQPKAFVQHNDLCWFHASSVALLFSDASRKTLWNRLFRYRKESGMDIPVQLKPQKGADTAIYLALEIMRRSAELSVYQQMYDLERAAKVPKRDRRRNRRGSIMVCSYGTYNVICSLADWCVDRTTHEGRTKSTGGYAEGFMESFDKLGGIRILYSDTGKFRTPTDSFVIRYDTPGGGHFVCVYKCNGYWYLFNNADIEDEDMPFAPVKASEKAGTKDCKSLVQKLGYGNKPNLSYWAVDFTGHAVAPEYVPKEQDIPAELYGCNLLVRFNRFLDVLPRKNLHDIAQLFENHQRSFNTIFGFDATEADDTELIIRDLIAMHLKYAK